MSKTFDAARALGGACVLHSADGRMYRVDNWSAGTGQVWGREIVGAGDDYAAGDTIELPGDLEARVHVVGIGAHAIGWVLNFKPCAIGEARRKIAWQNEPRGNSETRFVMATWDAARVRFIADGRPLDVSEGPYTEAAWQDFTAGLPGVVVEG